MPETAIMCSTDMASIPAESAVVERSHRRQSRRRPKPDGRRWVVRRSKELRQHFTAKLGDREMTVELAAQVAKASELLALAEEMRSRMLRGAPDVCADDLVRVQRLADASLRALRLTAAPAKPAPTLGSLLRGERP